MKFVEFVRNFWTFSFVPAGGLFGWYLDQREKEKLSTFRHKSKLFQSELEPSQEKSYEQRDGEDGDPSRSAVQPNV